ncbi:hypothetical protein J2Z62_000406 [Mycoplasmoides fastidiosum]|uniref:Lipoprotein n=1 Tax=Mycoplasmoides fastidiosum TaxID=92758 RepID=A0ABU0LZ32_9BACT|nr:hypothetical protein [Mycoplasmoides fastidiosum]MDQ0513968.1 hypothetical protein [Mycoplasmoides fastidiosum]UUD37618.1 hypothetical protein NPA10_03560 [Mycoplasmoides fastidiosum]
MFFKFLKKVLAFGAMSLFSASLLAACGDHQNGNHVQTQKRQRNIDYRGFAIKPQPNVEDRILKFPAAIAENKLNAEGKFRFQLHHSPVQGLMGEWTAYATRVKAMHNNDLFQPITVYSATATVQAVHDIDAESSLVFVFDQLDVTKKGQFFTFYFIKNDGSQRILFSQVNIENNRDIFPIQ